MAQSLSNKSRLLEKYVQVVREDGLNTNKNVNIGINGSTPNLWVAGNVSIGGTLTTTGTGMEGAQVITAASANALSVGANGTTNPVFNVDTSTTSVATGLNITGAAAASGVALAVTSSGTNEALTIDAKGTGGISLNNVGGSGTVTIGHSLIVGAGGSSIIRLTTSSSGGIVAGPNGATNPAFNLDASTASSVTGLNVKSAASGGGVALSVISSGSNENFNISAKGTGNVALQPSVVATSGGANASGVTIGSIGVGFFTGTGAPTFSAMNGSVYVNSAATTTTTRIYVNNSGAGTAGTTWTNLTTAA